MDVMEPKLVWVEGRCYRFYESDVWSAKDLAATPYNEESNVEEFCDLNEDSCPIDIEIKPAARGRYQHSFYIPKAYFRFIVGPCGKVLRKLETETKTSINIPKMGIDGDIVITGTSTTAILSARHRIDLLVEFSKKKLKPTHFLSIPMNDENIIQNYQEFKKVVLDKTSKGARGVQEEIFQKPEKMHLTLGMLCLLDDNDVKAAVDALQECREKIVMPFVNEHGPIIIKAQGLECFNDDPSEVRVIFGKISSDNDALPELVEKIVDFFVEKDIMKRQYEKVTMHLTVMNISFLIDKVQPKRGSYPENFDATNILKVHKDYFFGESILSTIQLCQRGEKAPNGYYVIRSKINLID